MSKKKKRRHPPGGQSSQNFAPGQRELLVRTLAQEPHARLRVNAAGVEKMSDVLLRFAEPILNRSAPIDEKKATLLFAITAWNYCLTPSEERSHMRRSLPHIFNNPHYRADFEMLIQRKTELFPQNRRLIMGLEVAETGDRMHVNVVSTDLDRMGQQPESHNERNPHLERGPGPKTPRFTKHDDCKWLHRKRSSRCCSEGG